MVHDDRKEQTATLQVPEDRFYGRDSALDRLAEARRAQQPVEILGVPGAGKTRLMLEFGRQLQQGPAPVDVWVCDLSTASTEIEVLAAVTAALQIEAPNPRADRIGRELARRGAAALLIDNAEQVAGVVKSLVEAWQPAAPEATLVVTSRERLGLSGGAAIVLESLDPDGAEALFLDRARLLDPNAGGAEAERAAVRQLVDRLDRLPLAIELAAAQIRLLRPAQLLARIEQRLDLLESQQRSLPARHRSLRASLDSAWDLLDPTERAVLAQSSIFRGGFTTAAAEAAIAPPPGGRTVVQALRTLIDRSLIRSRPHPDRRDEARLWLFESVATYAAQKLEDADRTAAEHRHARHYLAWAEAMRSSSDERLIASLAVEQANLWAARRSTDDPEVGARLAVCLAWLLMYRGPHARLFPLIDEALGACGIAGSVRSELQLARANALASQGRFGEAEAEIATCRDRDGPTGACEIELVGLLTTLWRRRGEIERAEALLRSTLDALPPPADGREAVIHQNLRFALARLLRALGRPEQAVLVLESVLASGALRFLRDRAHTIGYLGSLHHDLGNLLHAADRLRQGVAGVEGVGAWHTEAYLRLDLSFVLLEQQQIAAAFEEIDHASARFQRVGNDLGQAIVALHRGFVLQATGATEDAERAFANVQHAPNMSPLAVGLAEAFRAAALADLDRLDPAEVLICQARGRVEAVGGPMDRACFDALAARIDLARSRRALAEGTDGRPHRDEAASRLQRAEAATGVSALVRHAVGLLRRAQQDTPDPARTLRVDGDGRWFQIGTDPVVSCERRRVIRRLLCALVQHRLEAPGEALDPSALIDRGWPREQILPTAAKTRLHTTLHTLRGLGLRPFLLTEDEGYLIDPAVSVIRVEA